MFDVLEREIRVGHLLAVIAWTAAVTLVGLAIVFEDLRFGFAGVLAGQAGIAVNAVMHNRRTRQVVRAIVNQLRQEVGR